MTYSPTPKLISFGKILFPFLLNLLRTFNPIAILDILIKISELISSQSTMTSTDTKKKCTRETSSRKSSFEITPNQSRRSKKIVSFHNPLSISSTPDPSLSSSSHKNGSIRHVHSSSDARNITRNYEDDGAYSPILPSIFSPSSSSSSPTKIGSPDTNTTNISFSNLTIATSSPSTPHEIFTEVCEIVILASSAIIALLALNPLLFASMIVATIITMPIWIVVAPVVCILIGLVYFHIVPVAYVFLWTGLKVTTGIRRLKLNKGY
ncbi:14967_t:CDS:1 [Acaulospora morrowiae]|uniref:14967_t:CDS:1 n=1 Tax=Acaulospora morrowiae TaxID=94023 RepID=A0A9N9ASB9_9GLOM|nr:14967_t:CDS:1 [Acaulospora morrowiae]